MHHLVVLAFLFTAIPAHAGGGAHLVDDAGTVTPGECEVELYGGAAAHAGRLVLSPTCAFTALPNLEFGLVLARDWPGGSPIPGVAAKAALGHLGPIETAFELNLGYDPEGQTLDSIATNLPLTLPLGRRLTLHANLGLDFEPGAAPIPTWGTALILALGNRFEAVAEIAGRQGFRTRTQAGVRAHVGRVSLDLLYSRNLDNNRSHWLTLGATWAFNR